MPARKPDRAFRLRPPVAQFLKGTPLSETVFDTPESDVTEVTSDEAVEEGAKTVPVERFNGLQRKLQQTLAENARLKASGSPKPEAKREVMPEEVSNDLQTVLEGMAAEVHELRRDKWLREAIAAHPEVAPFADLIQGNTREAFFEVVTDLSTRLKPPEKTEEGGEQVTTPTTQTPPVPAGTPAIVEPSPDEELAQLRQEAGRTHDWSSWLKKKFELAGAEYPE